MRIIIFSNVQSTVQEECIAPSSPPELCRDKRITIALQSIDRYTNISINLQLLQIGSFLNSGCCQRMTII